MKITRKQSEALKTIYQRHDIGVSFLTFRRSVHKYMGGNCILVYWAGMWLGIEKDGYTHS